MINRTPLLMIALLGALLPALGVCANDPPTAEDDLPPREMPRPPHDGPPGPRLSEEEFKERLELLRELHPDLAERLEQLKDRNPQRVGAMIREHFPRLGEMLELRRRDPELFELRVKDIRANRKTLELAERYRQARRAGDQAQSQSLRDELQAAIREHFEVRQAQRERELAMLEERLEELRQRIKERTAQREELIQKRISELSEKARDAEW